MKNLIHLVLLVAFTSLPHTALAVEQTSTGMMQNSGMMSGGFMWLCVVLVVLLIIALVLAIMSMAKYLFFSKSRKGDQS